MASEGPKVKASVETMAYYNMILTEAIFQLLEEKGLLTPMKGDTSGALTRSQKPESELRSG